MYFKKRHLVHAFIACFYYFVQGTDPGIIGNGFKFTKGVRFVKFT